jgi:group II intron reverse transcriptase/maturase
MVEKVPERTVSSYVSHGEVNESLQPITRVLIPGSPTTLETEQKFYIMASAQFPSTRRIASSFHNIGGHLKETHGDALKNSGMPESGNAWGIGGFVVGPAKGRTIHTSAFLSAGKKAKGASLLLSNDIKPTGLLKLEKLMNDNKAHKNLINYRVIDIVADPDILKTAYARIKSKPGNMTPGVDDSTLDGINQAWFDKTSKELHTGVFKFHPARRVEIPKASGGTRPLGVASPRDKIVQEAMRMVLENIYEPSFSVHSHGFRPARSCHSALQEIKRTFSGTSWFIEGDISKCFDSFDHSLLIKKVEERVNDQVFNDLMRKALKAGYMFQGDYFSPDIGTPQGSIVSPILCNVLMHDLDMWFERKAEEFNTGARRRIDPRYKKLTRHGNLRTAHIENLSSRMAKDPDYKRIKYVRYADDFLIGIIGSKADCIAIKTEIADFLKNEVKLNLNLEKTKITHASTEMAKFLGTQIRITPLDKRPYRQVIRGQQTFTMRPATRIQLLAPITQIVERLISKKIAKPGGKPTRWTRMIPVDSAHTVNLMFSMWRGIANYYSFADNYGSLGRIHYILKYSCLLTLVSKYKLGTMKKGYKKFGKDLIIKEGEKILASFPNVSLVRKKTFSVGLANPVLRLEQLANAFFKTRAKLASACYVCDSEDDLQMHHVKHIRKVTEKIELDYWTRVMATMNRKQLVVCRECHNKIHNGEYNEIALAKLADFAFKKEQMKQEKPSKAPVAIKYLSPVITDDPNFDIKQYNETRDWFGKIIPTKTDIGKTEGISPTSKAKSS